MDYKKLTNYRVLLLAEYGASGGTRTYCKQLLTLYAEKRIHVTLLRTYEEKDEEMDSLCLLYCFDCVNLSTIVHDENIFQGRFPHRLLLEQRLFWNFIKKSRFDIVIASVGTPELFLGIMSITPKSIYILHTYPASSRRPFLGMVKRLIFSLFIPSSTKIITVSAFAKRCILNAWRPGANSNNVKIVYSTMGKIAKINQLPKLDAIEVLTIGHVVAYKNPVTWINMATLLRKSEFGLKVKFTWVGDGAMLADCRERVKEFGAESYISFVGHDNAITKYYEQCDIYVQPSHIESLGLSVLDAMRHGKPCVVANTGGLPEVIQNGKSGWIVEADDFKAMAHKVGVLARDKGLRETMGQHAQRVYEEVFSSERWEEEMWSHHKNMLKS